MKITKLLILILISTIHLDVSFARLSKSKSLKVDSVLKNEMKSQKIVGLSVGIFNNNKLQYMAAYGFADLAKKTPATTKTVFNLASNSKPMASYMAMCLVRSKKLKLNSDIRKYIPEWNSKSKVITVGQLLSHTSGMPHYKNGKIIGKDGVEISRTEDIAKSILSFSESPLLFTPGKKYSYSSYGYVLLSLVLERAGNMSYDMLTKKYIGRPIKMKSLQLDYETVDQKYWSKGYSLSQSGDIKLSNDVSHYWKFGAGGYKCNIHDFSKWALHLLKRRGLNRSSYDKMWKLPKSKSSGMALGFFVSNKPSLKISHNGKQSESTTRMVLYPKRKHGIVIMTNSSHADISKITSAIYTVLK